MPAEPAPGHPEILRIVAANPGPMTLTGTNTYLVGSDPVWVIDPGPDDAAHLDTIRAAAAERGGIGGVVLTHSHLDHSAGVAALGAELRWGRTSGVDEAGQLAAALVGGPQPGGAGAPARRPELPATVGPFGLLATPGHADDHVALIRGDVCFCGDLILGEGSSIVPPASAGGSLGAYMDSLDRVEALGAALLCPGHGPWISDPAARIAEYREHRLDRERMLLAALDAGARSRDELLDAAWGDVATSMRPAAALALQAHLEKLAVEDRLPDGIPAI